MPSLPANIRTGTALLPSFITPNRELYFSNPGNFLGAGTVANGFDGAVENFLVALGRLSSIS